MLTFWAKGHGANDPISAVFDNSLGAAHNFTGSPLVKRQPGYGIGLTVESHLRLADPASFLTMLACIWRTASRLRREVTLPWVLADAVAIQAALFVFVFYLVCLSALLGNMACQIIFYNLPGYLAWLRRPYTTHISTGA